MRSSAAVYVFLASLAFAQPCPGQDVQEPHAEQRLNGLKALDALAVVVRHNASREFGTPKEWGDIAVQSLGRNLPELAIADGQGARAWLEVNIIATESGSLIELSLQRWTTLAESGEQTFSKVWWDSEMAVGHVSRRALEESLATLLRTFTDDYRRAQPAK